MVTNTELESALTLIAMGYYASADYAHKQDHIELVLTRATDMMDWLNDPSIDKEVVITACILHDIGSCVDREKHAEESYNIMRKDPEILKLLPKESVRKINVAYCILQHSSHFNKPYYSKEAEIVASADRDEPDIYSILSRSVEYGKKHFPDKVVEEVSKYNIKRYKTRHSSDYRVPEWHYAYWNEKIPNSMINLNRFFSNEDNVKYITQMIYDDEDENIVREMISTKLRKGV